MFIKIYLANQIIQMQSDLQLLNKVAYMLVFKPIKVDKIEIHDHFFEWKPDTSM